MRDYGRVYTKFWVSPDIIGLSDDAKLIALYLLTGQHSNALGCFRLPPGYVSSDMQWNSLERVSKGFAELSGIGFVSVGKSDWLLLPKYLKFNQPENPNVGKMIAKLYHQIPESSGLIAETSRAVVSFPEKLPDELVTICKGFAKPFNKPFATVSETPEPEPEPEPEPIKKNNKEVIEFKSNSQRFKERFAKCATEDEKRAEVDRLMQELAEEKRAKY
jgi:hypothetical protein